MCIKNKLQKKWIKYIEANTKSTNLTSITKLHYSDAQIDNNNT